MIRILLLLAVVAQLPSTVSSLPKVLLISFDGFRYDLLNKTMVPNIHKWAEKNSWFVNGVQSQYITYTAPNHMSIATGLMENAHGIVSNYFYDPLTKEYFDYFNSTHKEGVVNASLAEHWYVGEPIWLTNERAGDGRRSTAFYWPNGEASYPFPPHKPTIVKQWTTYRTLNELMADVDEIVSLFNRKQDPHNFVAWYVAEPDHTLHTNGFYNGALKEKLHQLDELFAYLLAKVEDGGLTDQLNIILTADHGHAEIINEKHVMCLRDYVHGEGFELGDHMIYPKDEQHAKDIYRNLTDAIEKYGYGVKVYLNEDFPERYNYKGAPRVGRIIIEPEVGSATSFSCSKEKLDRDYGASGVKFNSSTHGQAPERPEMHAFLVMAGPRFKKNLQISDIPQNIDLYGLLSHILEVKPSPNNGTMNIVEKALLTMDGIEKAKDGNDDAESRIKMFHEKYDVFTDSLGFLVFVVPSVCVVMAFLIYGCRRTIMKDDPGWARKSNGYRPIYMDNPTLEMGDESRTSRHGGHDLGTGSVAMSGLLKNMEGDSSEDEF